LVSLVITHHVFRIGEQRVKLCSILCPINSFAGDWRGVSWNAAYCDNIITTICALLLIFYFWNIFIIILTPNVVALLVSEWNGAPTKFLVQNVLNSVPVKHSAPSEVIDLAIWVCRNMRTTSAFLLLPRSQCTN